MSKDHFNKSGTIYLREIRDNVGLSSMEKALNEPNIETVERCKICHLGFKSRWGEIFRCSDHSYLEETPISKPIKKLRK